MRLVNWILVIIGGAMMVVAVVPIASVGSITIYQNAGGNPGITPGLVCNSVSWNIAADPWYSSWFYPSTEGYPSQVVIKAIAPSSVIAYLAVYVEGGSSWGVASGSLQTTVTSYPQEFTIDTPSGAGNLMSKSEMYRLKVGDAGSAPVICISSWFIIYGNEGGGDGVDDTGCPDGYHWDIALGYCVPNEEPPDGVECDPGYHWNDTAGECEQDATPPPPEDQGAEEDTFCRFPMVFIIGLVLVLIGIIWRH